MAKKEEKKEGRMDSSKEGLGISGFILGIISAVFLITYMSVFIVLVWVLALLGLVFCIIQQKKNKTRLGKIGLIISTIVLIVSTGLIAYYLPQEIAYLKSGASAAA